MSNLVVISPDDLQAMIRDAVKDAMQAATKPETWLPVSVVSERLGKSEKTIRNWISDGRFQRWNGGDGKPYLVSSLEVDALSRDASSSPDAS